MTRTFGSVPGVVTRVDLTAPPAVVRAVRGAAATVVHLGGPSSPLFHLLHARDPRTGEQVYLAAPTWQTWQPKGTSPALAQAGEPLTRTSRRCPRSRLLGRNLRPSTP